jgi:hypothetical protein
LISSGRSTLIRVCRLQLLVHRISPKCRHLWNSRNSLWLTISIVVIPAIIGSIGQSSLLCWSLLTFSLSSFSCSLSILLMNLQLSLHLMHHLLHPDRLPLILTMNLLFHVLLNIHIIQRTHNLTHLIKLVNGWPEFFES